MSRRLLRTQWSKQLSSIYQLCTVFSLANRMDADNVIELCGTDDQAVIHAVECLKRGEIIAVPTDTVFGLAVDSYNTSAIASLYEIKGRDTQKPLAICVANVNEVKKYGVSKDLPKGLLNSLLPGPVTLLLNRKRNLNPNLNPGVTKVGIRVPEATSYPFIQDVATALGRPLALTSANLSNEPNCVFIEEFKHLWPKLGGVYRYSTNVNGVNDKVSPSREGSTIIDLSEVGQFKITRNGVAYSKTLATLLKFGLKELT